VADAVAQKAGIVVRAVDARLDAVLRQKRLDLAAGNIDERPHQALFRDRGHGSQSSHAAAGEQPKEQRLGLIVLMGSSHDEGGTDATADLVERLQAHFPRGGLDSSVPHRRLIASAVGALEWNGQAGAELADEVFVGVGFVAPEMMIDVRRGQLEAAVAELRESDEQRRGVATAGTGHQKVRGADAMLGKEVIDCFGQHGASISHLECGGHAAAFVSAAMPRAVSGGIRS